LTTCTRPGILNIGSLHLLALALFEK